MSASFLTTSSENINKFISNGWQIEFIAVLIKGKPEFCDGPPEPTAKISLEALPGIDGCPSLYLLFGLKKGKELQLLLPSPPSAASNPLVRSLKAEAIRSGLKIVGPPEN
jgi:hypothetical protein